MSRLDEGRREKCRKYFIFKILDVVNNSFHILEEKRMESLSQYLEICIGTYDELRMSLDQTKLKKSYEALLEGLDFQMQNHPFNYLELYQHDFAHLHGLIGQSSEAREREIHIVHQNLVALKKKLEADNKIESYIQCLMQEENFGVIDYLIEAFISDLLHMGYSLKYINDYFKEQQRQFLESGDSEKIICNLRLLNKEPEEIRVFIHFRIDSVSQVEAAKSLIEKQFHLGQEPKAADMWNLPDWMTASKTYYALDSFKAVEQAGQEFQALKALFNMWQGTQNSIRDRAEYGWEDAGGFYTTTLKNISNTKMLSYIDNNYRKQMERYLSLRREPDDENMRTLERILYTLNAAKTYTIQNRFLNFWSSLEYILHPFPRYTIIEKARVVVPEVFSLFYLKNKMNIFWARLNYCMEKNGYKEKYPALNGFCQECSEDKDYSTRKVISYLQKKDKYEEMVRELSFHIVLERECRELIMLLNDPRKAYKAIQEYYDGIRHDLNYIYRLRNQLIHSAKDIDDSLEYISFQLYRYVNSVLSTILYYEEKNRANSMIDILGSIDATYQRYSSKWNDDGGKRKRANKEAAADLIFSAEEGYQMVRPKYLFLE
ncbi:MAG: hypothetical protein Q4F29_03575 [Lachnospiraceae bacterium]|nr:hypothetical protein [Lachnospiraceae bacterium]